jgi:hypothetical protein
MSNLQKEIEEFFVEYSKRWNSQNYGTLAELWDRDDPAPFYRAMEREQPTATWPELERYWSPVPGRRVIDGLWNIYSNLRVKAVGPDVAVVLFDLEWDIKPPRVKPMSGTDPGLAVLRRRPAGWRMVAYVEACMHAAGHVRVQSEQNVRPSFVRFLAEQIAAAPDAKGPGGRP